jgi:TonB family protein
MQRQVETSSALISETFGLLPRGESRLSSFVKSLVVNLLLGSLLVWFTMTQLHRVSPPSHYVNELVFLKRLSAVTPVLHIKVHPSRVVTVHPNRIEMPKPLPQPPKVAITSLSRPPMPAIPLPQTKQVVAAAQPRVGLFRAPKPLSTANSKSTPSIKAGGFGDPSGVAVNPNATRPSTVAAIGSFNNAPGARQGAGTPHGGVVEPGGFGSGVGRGTEAGGGHGNVATGGFGANGIGGGGTQQAVVRQESMTPPQVLSEPHPRYTEEAKQLKIQGEITLQVRFGMNGKVEVLRVVTGLGHGLDEEARRVAEQIQFKPAARNGQPADHVTYIHIFFQLA